MSEATEKEKLLELLARRKVAYAAATLDPQFNANLIAGSPMYYNCALCNQVYELPEDYSPPRPTLCPDCFILRAKGWLQ